jgi:hypothetical protein
MIKCDMSCEYRMSSIAKIDEALTTVCDRENV